MNHYLVQVSNKAFVFGSPQTVPEQNVKASLAQAGLGESWDMAQVRVYSDDQVSSLKARVEAIRDRGEVTRLSFDPLALSK